MNKTAITVVIAIVSIFNVTAYAADTVAALQQKLDDAIVANKAEEALTWANALAAYKQAVLAQEQAKFVNKQNKALEVYSNIFKSAPAIISGLEKFNNLQKEPDKEFGLILKLCRKALVVVERPLTRAETEEAAVDVHKFEQERKAAWKAYKAEQERKWKEREKRSAF